LRETRCVEQVSKAGSGKRAVLYARISTGDQNTETQLYDLRELAKLRRYEIVHEYTDTISGAKSKRPGLDQLLADARRHRFDVVLVAAFDRVARNVRHFLEVLGELNRLNIEFVSLRENNDTGGPLGRAMVVIVGAIAELQKSLIVERVKAGMRRAKLEGRRIGRAPLNVDRAAIVRDRLAGLSLTEVAKRHRVSRATVCRFVNESRRLTRTGVPQDGVIAPIGERNSQIAA
jgi:DNA invertase Pin-like site-specific DNA recombinase